MNADALESKTLNCTACGGTFIFSVGEQLFFIERNLVNVPKRCPNCRLALRFMRNGRDVGQLSQVECADCSSPTRVPFRPRGHRPVFCNDCLARHRSLLAVN